MFKFIPFSGDHFNKFESWLQEEHVKRFWTESRTGDQLREKLLASPALSKVHRFVIDEDGTQIGYIQYYDALAVNEECWGNEKPGTFGMDIFIGEKARVGKGIGPKILKEFIAYLLEQEPSAKAIIIDPAPDNEFAILAYEKVGFTRIGKIETADGPAVLMRMNLSS